MYSSGQDRTDVGCSHRNDADAGIDLTSLRRVLLMHDLAQDISSEISAALAGSGYGEISATRWAALVNIATEQATIAVLARWMRMTRQSASTLVHELVSRGYVIGTFDEANRRRIPLRLTAEGREVLHAAEAVAREILFAWSRGAPVETVRDAFASLAVMRSVSEMRRVQRLGLTSPSAAPEHRRRRRNTGPVGPAL